MSREAAPRPRRTTVLPLAATLFTIVLATSGCLAPPAPAPAGPAPTSAVTGIILDQDGLPVADARIRILELERSTHSDDAGRFGFPDVAHDGPFLIVVEKPGYVSASSHGLVIAGYDTTVEMRLHARASLAGIVAPFQWPGELSCRFAAGPVTSAGDCYGTDVSNTQWQVPLEQDARGIVARLEWEPTATSTGALRLDILGRTTSGAWRMLTSVAGTGPLEARVDEAGLGAIAGPLWFRVDLASASEAVEAGAVYQQEFLLAANVHYRQPPPV